MSDDETSESADDDADIDSIEETSKFNPPLPDDQYSKFEMASVYVLLGSIFTLILGSLLLPSLFWDGFLEPMVWDPVNEDASQGDAGYNPINTMLFTSILLLTVVVLSAVFRKYSLPAEPRTILVFIPWVTLASIIRVLEDSELFPESYQILFISPVIHFHLALWVIASAALGLWAERLPNSSKEDSTSIVTGRHRIVSITLLLLMWLLIYSPALASDSTIGILWPIIALICSIMIATWLSAEEQWGGMERALLTVGWGGVIMGFGFWLQFQSTPWHPSNEAAWWPAFIILGIPTLICWQMFRMGNSANLRMLASGYESGVLPENISVMEWEKGEPAGKEEYEVDARMALLANPMVLAFTFGQLCDGLATWMGIDFFGYSEKHVVSAKIIDWGAAITGDAGAWLFFLTKALLTGALIWVFTEIRVEHRNRHLRLLIVLALLIVGLAPGLRDLGRLMLGV